MRLFTGALLIAAVILATASCGKTRANNDSDICATEDQNHVCVAPFAALYSHRQALVGRNIRVEGVVVVGVRPEPPGSSIPVVLLFPSAERARLCNPELAVELVASRDLADELSVVSGGFVSVAGKLQLSQKGHWSELVVTAAPSLLGGERGEFACMKAAPPAPPEP
jgi:hypothetical protein